MAQLKDLIVYGASRFLGKIYVTAISGNGSELTNLNVSNASSGTLSADRLATSGVTAGSYGPSANASPAHKGTFSVPYITVDAKGRVTAASTKTITLPSESTLSVTNSGSGNAVTAISASGHTITVTKGSTFSLSSHTHNTLDGTYTSNGGAQPPSYIASGKVRFNMMNSFKGLSSLPTYCDCLLMDTYSGTDVPWVTGFGIVKQDANPRAFLAVGAKGNTTTWKYQTEIITAANIGSQSVTKATQDSAGQQINTTYIKGLSVSGRTVTYTKGDGTTGTITTQDTNTTYSAATQSANGLMSAADKKKLDGIASGANAYSHPTSSGNKHIPSGGSSGQILRWSADGTAAWGSDNNTTYSAATQSAQGLMSAADKKKLDGIASGANAYSHPSHTAYSSGLYKITVNSLGHVTAATAVAKADITALGIPGSDTNTHYTTGLYVGENNTTKANIATTNGNTYLKLFDDSTRRASFLIVGSGATTVSTDASGNIYINSTDTNTWRGIQNNLSSTSTGDCLSAAQGKVLKDLVDGKAPAYSYSTTDLTAGSSSLTTGKLYFVYV